MFVWTLTGSVQYINFKKVGEIYLNKAIIESHMIFEDDGNCILLRN